jgi:choline dehydrogenase-like flavoprotein
MGTNLSEEHLDGWIQDWSPLTSDTATESGSNWGWSEFDKFVRKSCTLTTGDTVTGDGPIQLSILNDSEPKDKETWTKVWTDTWSNLGYPTADPFSPNVKGAVRNFKSTDPVHKQRSGAARAYLTAAVRERENLTVIANATVTKILFHELPPTEEEVHSSHSGGESAAPK